jgi:hypothetical protein
LTLITAIFFICLRRRRQQGKARRAVLASKLHYRKPERHISDSSQRSIISNHGMPIPMASRSPSTTLEPPSGKKQNRVSTYRKPVPAYDPNSDRPLPGDDGSISDSSLHSPSRGDV